jgi:Tol biopolymer transport system component
VRSGPLASRIWLLDPGTGDTVPLFEDKQTLGRAPLWSPAGQRLAFYSPTENAVQIYDTLTGQLQSFETLSGIGSWSPQGDEMVIPDAASWSDRSTGYIARVDLLDGSTMDISAPTATTGDASPAWSPTGEWIAFGRFSLADGSATQGRQLWLMRPDGSEAVPLVTDADAEFAAYSWRPDGGALAYIRLPLPHLADPHPEIWIISLPDGQPQHMATDATVPGWLP